MYRSINPQYSYPRSVPRSPPANHTYTRFTPQYAPMQNTNYMRPQQYGNYSQYAQPVYNAPVHAPQIQDFSGGDQMPMPSMRSRCGGCGNIRTRCCCNSERPSYPPEKPCYPSEIIPIPGPPGQPGAQGPAGPAGNVEDLLPNFVRVNGDCQNLGATYLWKGQGRPPFVFPGTDPTVDGPQKENWMLVARDGKCGSDGEFVVVVYNPGQSYDLCQFVRFEGNCDYPGGTYQYIGNTACDRPCVRDPLNPIKSSPGSTPWNEPSKWKVITQDGRCGTGLYYRGCYDPCLVYYLNNIVRVDDYDSGKLYIYTLPQPSGPYPEDVDIEHLKGWKFFLKDGTMSSFTSETSVITNSARMSDNNYEKARPLFFRGDWSKSEDYETGDLIRYKNTYYFCLKKCRSTTPSSSSAYWDVFLIGSMVYKGNWKQDREYHINHLVKYNCCIYICNETTKSCPDDNSDKWTLLIKESLDESADSNKYLLTHDSDFSSMLNTAIDFDSPLSKSNDYYYAVKSSDSKFNLSLKKSKILVPILFDKTIERSDSIEQTKNSVTFNRPGLYKVTMHIMFTGVNFFKCIGYMMRASDDAESYSKDKKIPGSSMSLMSSSLIKNNMHYSFLLKVEEPMSSIVMASVHHNKAKHSQDEKELTIFGKERTFILIERMD